MADEILLQCDGPAVRITEAEGSPGWYRCTLCTEDAVRLGAGTGSYLAGRLAELLRHKSCFHGRPGVGKIEGRDVRWVLSLSEDHATLYAAEQGGGWALYWQAADTRII